MKRISTIRTFDSFAKACAHIAGNCVYTVTRPNAPKLKEYPPSVQAIIDEAIDEALMLDTAAEWLHVTVTDGFRPDSPTYAYYAFISYQDVGGPLAHVFPALPEPATPAPAMPAPDAAPAIPSHVASVVKMVKASALDQPPAPAPYDYHCANDIRQWAGQLFTMDGGDCPKTQLGWVTQVIAEIERQGINVTD